MLEFLSSPLPVSGVLAVACVLLLVSEVLRITVGAKQWLYSTKEGVLFKRVLFKRGEEAWDAESRLRTVSVRLRVAALGFALPCVVKLFYVIMVALTRVP